MEVPGFIMNVYYHSEIINKKYYTAHNKPQTFLEKLYPSSGYPEEEREAVLKDMKDVFAKYGMHYDEYFFYDCYKKSPEYLSSFINETNRFYYYNKLNVTKNIPLFDDKYLTYSKYGEYYGRDVIKVSSKKDFQKFCDFVKKHPKFIRKPYNLYCGFGVGIFNVSDYKSNEELFEVILKEGGSVCEELITQSSEMAAFNETSVNTVRVTTILTGNEGNYKVNFFHPFFRVGKKGAIVDNCGSGGIFVMADAETGALYPVGRDESNVAHTKSPDSGIVFDGYYLPRWEEAKALARKLALVTPSNRYTGWDLALTPSGWIMVEGNQRGQFLGPQICDRIGKRGELDSLCRGL